jgi:hypothetical protein
MKNKKETDTFVCNLRNGMGVVIKIACHKFVLVCDAVSYLVSYSQCFKG